MNEHEQKQIEELDAYFTARQSGESPFRPESLQAEDSTFVDELLLLTDAFPPEPDFAAHLERQLAAAIRQRQTGKKRVVSRAKEPKRAMNMRTTFYWMSAAVTVAIVVFGVALLLGLSIRPMIIGDNPSPTFDGHETPAVGTTIAPPAATSFPWPEEPPQLPLLASQMGGGFGGSGSNGSMPPTMVFVLNTALPDGPDQLTVYARPPELLTIDWAKAEATRWGLDAEIKMPLWMIEAQSSEEVTGRSYSAVDEPVHIDFEGTERLIYHDRRVIPEVSGRINPPHDLSPVDQAVETARQFLESRGLLTGPYKTEVDTYDTTGTVSFFTSLDGQLWLADPLAQVLFGPEGQIGTIAYQNLTMRSLGEYPLISAGQAWDRVNARDASGRVWYEVTPVQSAGQNLNPRFWLRDYPSGQMVHLFGPLQIQYSTESGGSPHITMNNLVLSGNDLTRLAQSYEDLRATTMDTESPVHIWGSVSEADGYSVLQVEGWESAWGLPYSWSGTIRRDGDRGLLVLSDGSSLELPGLPVEAVDGANVFVEGVEWEGKLEWRVVQEYPVTVIPAGSTTTTIEASVDRVELVYRAPSLTTAGPELYSDLGYRSIQPVWLFSGHTSEGSPFKVYVQAVNDAYLSQ